MSGIAFIQELEDTHAFGSLLTTLASTGEYSAITVQYLTFINTATLNFPYSKRPSSIRKNFYM